MTTRILPPDEWHKLAHTDVPAILPYVDPSEIAIVVLEDGDRIVGCWTVLQVTHVEGLWIDPAYRGKPSAARQLFAATWRVVRGVAKRWVMTAAQDDLVRRLLTKHVGAVAIPGEMFVIPVHGAGACRLQQ